MIDKMNERSLWKNVSPDIGKNKYKQLKNQLRRETGIARDNWLNEECAAIEELDRKGRPDLIYIKIKRLTIGVKKDIKNSGIEDKNGKLLFKSYEQRTR